MSFEERAMEGAEPQAQAQEISGWAVGFTVFAGVLMITAGIFWFLIGLGGLLENDFNDLARAYAYDMSVDTWGWIHVIGGTIVAISGLYLFTGNILARIIAITIAVVAAIINFLYIPYYPIWSLTVIAICGAVIWALTAHGRDIAAGAESTE